MRKWRCVKVAYANELTLGKIYETNDDGYGLVFDNGIEGSYEITKYASVGSEFEEIKEEDEKVREFKVGDKVRILDGSKIKDYTGGWYAGMKIYIGEIKTISDVNNDSNKRYRVYLEESDYVWDTRGLELVNENNSKSIHITFDNNTTHAVLKDGKSIIKRAKVGLYHGDEYKFETGVIEVVKKLFNEETEAHKKFKVGDKVRIVKNISNIKNWNDRMDEYIGKVMTIDNIRHSMVGSRLIYEMKEDKCRWNWEEDYVEDINTVHSYKQLSDHTSSELLDEIKRRMEK